MEKLVKMVQRFEGVNVDEIIKNIIEKSPVDDTVLNLNRQQLDSGIDAKGQKMHTYKARRPDVYSKYTIAIKQMTGQPYDRVTLKDTGSFQKELEVKSFDKYFSVLGDTIKSDGDMMDNIDVNQALGLTPENIRKLKPVIVPEMVKEIKSVIL